MRKTLFSILLLLLAGVQTTKAQPGMVVWQDGKPVVYHINKVERVEFLDDVSGLIEREYVDLGLPSGTLWATCNVGAENPEDYGDLFAWGETETKESFTWGNYKWMTAGQEDWKYINKYTIEDGQKGGCWYSGDTFVGDGNRTLLKDDDAAAKNWGSKWQMPSREQFEELMNSNYTSQDFTTLNGVNGYKITGKNGNSIFLPAAGSRIETTSVGNGSFGHYWSRSLGPTYTDYASYLNFGSTGSSVGTQNRNVGRSVRPVRKSYEYVDLGLPSGTLWAACNIGADSPEEYGDYFAWGETETKEYYDDNTYKYLNTWETIAKYDASIGMSELLPDYDVATAKWGDSWQMPGYHQYAELIDEENTTTVYTTQNGVNGLKITSNKNGNSIFLPAAGKHLYDNLNDASLYGYYWSCTVQDNHSYVMYFDGERTGIYIGNREEGFTVRPVRKK